MEKLRVAMLGCGGIAKSHVMRFGEHADAELVALCDVDMQQTEGMKAWFDENHPGVMKPVPEFADAAQMYAEVQPDAVSIATPHTLHFEHCCQAIDAGCHVLIEKPMVTSLRDAVALEQKVADSGKHLQIAYITPSRAECQRVRAICRSGEYGRLKVVNCSISQPWYQGTTGKWRQDPELSGGGMIYDSGAHVLNTLVWTVESDVSEVHAYVDNLDTRVDINGTINVRFTNGVIACVAVCGEAPSKSGGVWNFEKATVALDPWVGTGLQVLARTNGHIEEADPAITQEDSSPQHNFVDAILGRAEPATSARNGVIQSQLMDAVYDSARTGAPARPGA